MLWGLGSGHLWGPSAHLPPSQCRALCSHYQWSGFDLWDQSYPYFGESSGKKTNKNQSQSGDNGNQRKYLSCAKHLKKKSAFQNCLCCNIQEKKQTSPVSSGCWRGTLFMGHLSTNDSQSPTSGPVTSRPPSHMATPNHMQPKHVCESSFIEV